MAKRFTCTDKWKKPFLRGLETPYKLLWFYILDDCDHSGVWQVDIEVAEIRTGEKFNIEKALENFGEKVIAFDNGEKWFIPDFIDFQYGELNAENRAHKSVLSLLDKYKNKGLRSPLEGAKDKDMDKDMVKVKDKVKDKGAPIFTKCKNFYFQWYENKFKIKPDFDGSDGKALKDIINYFNIQPGNSGDEKIYLTWTTMLSNFDKWEKFHQGQTRVRQINSNKSNIINYLKNGKARGVNAETMADAMEKEFSPKHSD